MGSYFELSIDDRGIWYSKNYMPFDLDYCFLEEDRFEHVSETGGSDYQERSTDAGYRVSLRIARFRLALRGYKIVNARNKYESWQAEKRKPPTDCAEPSSLSDEFYRKHSFADYVLLLKHILQGNDESSVSQTDLEYIFPGPIGYYFGFPSTDPHYALSILLHVVEGDRLTASLGAMIDGGFWDLNDPLSPWEKYLIVLTEGKTDANVLQDAFRLFYPDHLRTIRFFDYNFRPQGGAGNNVNLLKSFAAAGISNPVLAVFDNDTAGHKALADAKSLHLPANFMMMTYPDIELARQYPTLGPTGLQTLDVNQRACGIEMYLGHDCLTKSGSLIPVRWTGYDETMKRYQGKVGDKNFVIESFNRKIRNCDERLQIDDRPEWHELHSVMDAIERVVLGEQIEDLGQ